MTGAVEGVVAGQLQPTDKFLDAIAAEIRDLEHEGKRNAFDSACRIGERLAKAQEHLSRQKGGDGGWLEWLNREFPHWSERAAYNYLGMFKFVERHGGQFANFANSIDLSAAYVLGAPSTPDEARKEAAGLAADGGKITHATAKAIVTKYKRKAEPAEPLSASTEPAPSAARGGGGGMAAELGFLANEITPNLANPLFATLLCKNLQNKNNVLAIQTAWRALPGAERLYVANAARRRGCVGHLEKLVGKLPTEEEVEAAAAVVQTRPSVSNAKMKPASGEKARNVFQQDGEPDLPTDEEGRFSSLDEQLGNELSFTKDAIEGLALRMWEAGRLPELFRRFRKLIDKIEAESVAKAEPEGDAKKPATAPPAAA